MPGTHPPPKSAGTVHRAIKRRSYKAITRLSLEAGEGLTWWINSLSEWNGRKVSDPKLTTTVETDAYPIVVGERLVKDSRQKDARVGRMRVCTSMFWR